MADYGKRGYASPANNHPTYINEITDQYIFSIGGIYPADFKRPYTYEDYTSMQYLFNSPTLYLGGEAPTLSDFPEIEFDSDMPVVSWPSLDYPDAYDPPLPTYTPPGINPYPLPKDTTTPTTTGCDCGQVDNTKKSHIGYTTNQMAVEESQMLYVHNAQTGCIYTWTLTGGGSFSVVSGKTFAIGLFVTYYAPDSNANCENNATIKLRCNDIPVDTLEIAINANTGGDLAYVINGPCLTRCLDDGFHTFNYYYYKTQYHCDGTIHVAPEFKNLYQVSGMPSCAAAQAAADGSDTCVDAGGCCNLYTPGTTDFRSEAQKAAGCCPAALL